MCGIAGVYCPTGTQARDVAEKMVKVLQHRGPDDNGVWYNPTESVVLVHRRLSILDLSQAGHQPMAFEERGLWISYNGEVYNFLELREELQQLGYSFFSNTDTEVILKGYDAWGDGVFARLRGMFALAIWDEKKQELTLVRDPLGIKPLYYATCGQDFVFGSELKALRQHPNFPTTVDINSLAYYISHLYVPEPRSIFEGVSRLPIGHILHVNQSGSHLVRYYEPEYNVNYERSYEETLEELVDVFRQSVKAHLIADVPIGVFLSGGIDSSIIVALMRQIEQDQIKSFTIGFDGDFQFFDERPYARVIADHFKTDHQEIVVQPNIVSFVENNLINTFDEPFGNPASMVADVLSEFTRREVTVALTGVGGDEFFVGYPRYIGMMWIDRYARLPGIIRRTAETTLGYLPRSRARRHPLERVRRLVAAAEHPLDIRYDRFTSFIPQAAATKWLSPDITARLDSNAYIVDNGNGHHHIINRLMEIDLSNYLPGDLLTYTDRTSMRHSLEVRVPLCDIRVAEFSRSIPAHYKLKGNSLKRMLKDAFGSIIPDQILYRKKQGFNVPLGHWLSGPLQPFVKEFLSPEKVRQHPYFDPKEVAHALKQFEQGQHQYSHLLWGLLIFNLWHEKMFTV